MPTSLAAESELSSKQERRLTMKQASRVEAEATAVGSKEKEKKQRGDQKGRRQRREELEERERTRTLRGNSITIDPNNKR